MMQTVTLELPDDVAEMINDKINRHGYTTAADVVLDGLLELQVRSDWEASQNIEEWLKEDVLPSLQQARLYPETLRTSDQVAAHLRTRCLQLAALEQK
jgi:antitoxin ParD1/3/4